MSENEILQETAWLANRYPIQIAKTGTQYVAWPVDFNDLTGAGDDPRSAFDSAYYLLHRDINAALSNPRELPPMTVDDTIDASKIFGGTGSM